MLPEASVGPYSVCLYSLLLNDLSMNPAKCIGNKRGIVGQKTQVYPDAGHIERI